MQLSPKGCGLEPGKLGLEGFKESTVYLDLM